MIMVPIFQRIQTLEEFLHSGSIILKDQQKTKNKHIKTAFENYTIQNEAFTGIRWVLLIIRILQLEQLATDS